MLYQTYWPLVHAQCRRLLPTHLAADDAAQEIFVKLIIHARPVPDGAATRRWLARVAKNHCLNRLRDEKRHQILALEVTRGWAPGVSEDPFVERDFLRRLVALVPHALSEVAWLRHVHGLRLDEIARTLRVSRRTVVGRLGALGDRARDLSR